MPTYLDAGPANVAAMNNLGESLQRTMQGLALQRNQAARDYQRDQLERLYFQLAQQKEAAEAPLRAAQVQEAQARIPLIRAEAGRNDAQMQEVLANVLAQKRQQERAMAMTRLGSASRSPMMMDLVRAPGEGGGPNPLLRDLQSAGAFPQGGQPTELGMDPRQMQMLLNPVLMHQAIDAARGGEAEGAAMMSPASAERLAAPIDVSPGHVVTDRFSGGPPLAIGQPQSRTGGLTREDSLEQFRKKQEEARQKLEQQKKIAILHALMQGMSDRFGETPEKFEHVQKTINNIFGKEGGSSQEEARMTKDGRTAIFDSQTKKFLRYAD